ncbi:hypothetical protein NDU88_005872 [Pleurodeles waltl]|uniref:Uncharacterized protein n=1 Tax=Pleurodeles waltl TaxID=8319 RepID=A0AAV7LQS1_PLEWA|nr:hypothetical protein NDU88_005872 [Pleurodeles waltl]
MQTNKNVIYAQPVQPLAQTEKEGDQGSKAPEKGTEDPIPSLKDLMVAIQGSKVGVIHKIDSVAVEVSLLQADLHKVLDRVVTKEKNIEALQTEVSRLHTTVSDQQKLTAWLDERAEDSEGQSADLFLEEWITTVLKPKRLSKFFLIERAYRALVPLPKPGAPTCDDSPPLQFLGPRYYSAVYLNMGPPAVPGLTYFHIPTLHPMSDNEKQRKMFTADRKDCIALNLKYGLLFPA